LAAWVGWVAQKTTFGIEDKTGLANFAEHHRFIDAVQGLSLGNPGTGSARMIDHDQAAARLERREQTLIHPGTIDRKISDVVIIEDDGNEIQHGSLIRNRVVEGPRDQDEIRLWIIGEPLDERRPRLGRLRPNGSARTDREREQLRRVTRAR